MPVYEYKCRKCGKEFEVFQSVTDDKINTCKFCKGTVEKLISLSTFHLKGTGWYVTDYGGRKAPPVSETKEEQKKSAVESSTSAADSSKPSALASDNSKSSASASDNSKSSGVK